MIAFLLEYSAGVKAVSEELEETEELCNELLFLFWSGKANWLLLLFLPEKNPLEDDEV